MSTNWPTRSFGISQELETRIDRVLNARFKMSLKDSAVIAKSIKTLSSFYIQNPQTATPWRESWCQIAYLAYYLPLNYIRAEAVAREAQRFGFFNDHEHVIDFGSGLGAGSLSLPKNDEFFFVEKSIEAQTLHYQLFGDLYPHREWIQVAPPEVSEKTLGVFSYSLTEVSGFPDWAYHCESLMILEPSTSSDARLLMKLREELIQKGFSIWGPCVHQKPCPLLQQSKSDWCHDRIHFNQPKWFSDIEMELPFKNRTLTMSYLLASRRPAPKLVNAARMIGDMLQEKGKTRQLVCRGDSREFFTWLHRDLGEPIEIPRGTLVRMPESFEAKGNELRLQNELKPYNTERIETPEFHEISEDSQALIARFRAARSQNNHQGSYEKN